MITKKELDELVKKYEVKSFIFDDPSMFLYKYENENDIEIASFISALFAFGKREMFLKKLNEIFEIMKKPHQYILNFDIKTNDFKGFKYRFIKEEDLFDLLFCLNKLYKNGETLKTLFEKSYEKSEHDILKMLQIVIDYFYANSNNPDSRGFKHLLPNPQNGSAMKRLFMFLRWFVRDGEVDLGCWKFIDKSDLIIPMDTHVTQQAYKMGLLNEQKADYKRAKQLTEVLKQFDKNDPVKYDFALFGYGVSKSHI